MSPRIPVGASWGARRLTQAETRIREIQKRGPGPWVYVGTFPTDLYTTFWSPPWQNGFNSVAGKRVAFRHGLDGFPEFRGKFDTTGGASGDVAFTLPDDWIPDEEMDFIVTLDMGGGTFNVLRVLVDETTGDVTLYWPVT